jgi:sugar phosphate isomerase/epimerase
MKYSFMTFSTPELDLEGVLGAAVRFGYDGVEVRIDSKHAHGVELATGAEERKVIAGKVARSGVVLSCIATSCRFADPGTSDENVETARRAIDLAADVGAPCIRVFGGQLGEGLERAAAIDLVAAAVGKLAAQAEARSVVVCVETHDDWCDPAHLAAVLARVDCPWIAANWDIMHPIRRGGATMDSAFEALKPWIRHVHFHDGTLAHPTALTPIGEGEVDHKAALMLLKEIDYGGHLSGEWIKWQPYTEHLPRELATMKRYEREFDA